MEATALRQTPRSLPPRSLRSIVVVVGQNGHYCSKCRGDIKKSTKRVNKEGLQSLLTTKVQGAADKVPVQEFLKAVKQEMKTIFHRDDVPPLTN